MTIEENMALAYMRVSGRHSPFARVSGRDRALFRERLALLGMGLEDRIGTPVGLLSGGQRQALTMGNRTLMMNEGRIILDIAGEERERTTVDALLEAFKKQAGVQLDNDRILLSE